MLVKRPYTRCVPGVTTAAAFALLAACSTPPQSSSSATPLAKEAIDNAIHEGAAQRDPADLMMAQQKLALAQKSADNGFYDDARRFAEEAQIDAQLASARSRTVAASNALSQLQGTTAPDRE